MNRKAWQFFMEWAGYCTPPGRTVCAAELARAENEAPMHGITFEWHWEDDFDDSWMSVAERAKDHEWTYCVARGPDGDVLASLGGICDASREYMRVVEAELAAEALANLPARSVCP